MLFQFYRWLLHVELPYWFKVFFCYKNREILNVQYAKYNFELLLVPSVKRGEIEQDIRKRRNFGKSMKTQKNEKSRVFKFLGFFNVWLSLNFYGLNLTYVVSDSHER